MPYRYRWAHAALKGLDHQVRDILNISRRMNMPNVEAHLDAARREIELAMRCVTRGADDASYIGDEAAEAIRDTEPAQSRSALG